MFNRIADYVIHKRAIVFIIISIAALELMFLVKLFYPVYFDVLIKYKVFEIVVLNALIQIIVLLLRIMKQSPKTFFEYEHELEDAVRNIVQTDVRTRSVHVLSCGLGSKQSLLISLHNINKNVAIEVLAQNPEKAIDKTDAKRTETILDILKRDHPGEFKIHLFNEPATLRGIIICKEDRKPIWGVVSWYTYRHETGTDYPRVKGQNNPAFAFCFGNSLGDDKALEFFMKRFDLMWKNSHSFLE